MWSMCDTFGGTCISGSMRYFCLLDGSRPVSQLFPYGVLLSVSLTLLWMDQSIYDFVYIYSATVTSCEEFTVSYSVICMVLCSEGVGWNIMLFVRRNSVTFHWRIMFTVGEGVDCLDPNTANGSLALRIHGEVFKWAFLSEPLVLC